MANNNRKNGNGRNGNNAKNGNGKNGAQRRLGKLASLLPSALGGSAVEAKRKHKRDLEKEIEEL